MMCDSGTNTRNKRDAYLYLNGCTMHPNGCTLQPIGCTVQPIGCKDAAKRCDSRKIRDTGCIFGCTCAARVHSAPKILFKNCPN